MATIFRSRANGQPEIPPCPPLPKGGWRDFMDNLAFSPLLLSFAVHYNLPANSVAQKVAIWETFMQ
jgi:hypothetical protein